MKRYTCYLSLGANLGERGETLREALRQLSQLPETRLTAVSPFYETAPWGKLDQPAFLNALLHFGVLGQRRRHPVWRRAVLLPPGEDAGKNKKPPA